MIYCVCLAEEVSERNSGQKLTILNPSFYRFILTEERDYLIFPVPRSRPIVITGGGVVGCGVG